MFPSLTCRGPVLLVQGVRVMFNPQVMIVTWWVGCDSGETGPVKTTGVVTRPEKWGRGDKPESGTTVPTTTTTKHQQWEG